jgi:hypothetical protein
VSPEQWADGKVQTSGNLNEQKRLQRYVETRFSAAQNICGRWDNLVE